MASREWPAELETGHAAIDEQHRRLFALHGEALAAARGAHAPATRSALRRYLDATREHFAFEEQLMSASGHTARGHAADHAAFLADLGQLVAESERDGCPTLVRLWLESRCSSWWTYHVRSNDAALVARLRAAAPAPETASATATATATAA